MTNIKMPEHTPAPTPARSIYGFLLYFLSKTILGIYCAWAFLPDEILHYFNIYYYPQKYWAFAIPIQFLIGLTLFALVIYPSLNLTITPSTDSINTITDNYCSTAGVDCNDEIYNLLCVCKNKTQCIKPKYNVRPRKSKENIVPLAKDIDIRMVCRKMYLKP